MESPTYGLKQELEELRLEVLARRGLAEGAVSDRWVWRETTYEGARWTLVGGSREHGIAVATISPFDEDIESVRDEMRALEEEHFGAADVWSPPEWMTRRLLPGVTARFGAHGIVTFTAPDEVTAHTMYAMGTLDVPVGYFMHIEFPITRESVE